MSDGGTHNSINRILGPFLKSRLSRGYFTQSRAFASSTIAVQQDTHFAEFLTCDATPSEHSQLQIFSLLPKMFRLTMLSTSKNGLQQKTPKKTCTNFKTRLNQ